MVFLKTGIAENGREEAVDMLSGHWSQQCAETSHREKTQCVVITKDKYHEFTYAVKKEAAAAGV